MSERTKRLLVVVGFIASVFGIGAALYFVFFKAPAPPATVGPAPGEQVGGTLPSSGAAGGQVVTPPGGTAGGVVPGLPPAASVANGGRTETTAITQSAVSFPTIGADGKTMNFYNPADQKFYTVDKNGKLVLLSDKEFPNVSNAEWNKDSDKAVLEVNAPASGVIRKIVEAIAPRAGDTVVEIGPGLGALTEPLLERIARRGRDYETGIDARYLEDLSARYAFNEDVSVYARVAKGFRGPTIQGRSAVFMHYPPAIVEKWEDGIFRSSAAQYMRILEEKGARGARDINENDKFLISND